MKKKNLKIVNKEYISRKEFFSKAAKYAITGSAALAALLKTEKLHAFSDHTKYLTASSGSSSTTNSDYYTVPTGGENVGDIYDPRVNKPDTVNARTGNYSMNITDFVIPCMMLDFKFTRSYNSRLNYRGPFGNKWTHNYNHRIYDQGTYVDYFHGKGYIFRFENTGNRYTSPAGFNGTLFKNGNKFILSIQNDQIKFYFNEYGLFTRVEEKKFNSININYDNGNKIKNIVNTRGQKIFFEYDDAGRITKITLPDNGYYKYFYDDGKDNLTRILDYKGNEAFYIYDADHNLISKYDSRMPAGFNVVTIKYDGINRFKVMKDTINNIIASAAYDDEKINSFADALGNTRIYQFDEARNLIKLTNKERKITQYRYDANRNLTKIYNSKDNLINTAYTDLNLKSYTNGFWQYSWMFL